MKFEELLAELKQIAKTGHPKFLELVADEVTLYFLKNHDFAKDGDQMGNFHRVGEILKLYPGLRTTPAVIAIIYMMKQMDASLWMLANDYQGKVEGHAERWRDISVYAKIISILIEEEKSYATEPSA